MTTAESGVPATTEPTFLLELRPVGHCTPEEAT